jgi:hypothetical protein
MDSEPVRDDEEFWEFVARGMSAGQCREWVRRHDALTARPPKEPPDDGEDGSAPD